MKGPPLVGHLRERRRVYVGVLALVAASLALPSLPPPTVDGLAGDLGAVAAVEVSPGEIVWSSSRGLVSDLVGREVFFAGRRDGQADVFRASVSTTPGGRALLVRGVRRVTETSLADERDVALRDGWLAWGAHLDGRLVSIEAARASSAGRDPSGERRVVVLSTPSERARWELGRGTVRIDLDGRVAEVALDEAASARRDDHAVLTLAEPGGVEVSRPPWWGSVAGVTNESARFERLEPAPATDESIAELAPDERFGAGIEGAPAPVWSARVGELDWLRFDGRQLDWRAEPGDRVPYSDTGRRFVPAGPSTKSHSRDVATIRWSAPWRGDESRSYSFGGIDYGTIDGRGAIGWVGIDGGLRLEGPGGARPVGARSIWPWSSEAGAVGAVAWCSTLGGDLVVVRGRSLDAARAAVPKDCSRVVSLRADVDIGAASEASGDASRPRLVASLHDFRPPVAVPRGTAWTPRARGSASPAWAPSVFEAGPVERLGTQVRVTWIDTHRYEWVLRAGERERPMRGKGDWPASLGASSERARLAFASGLRRKPRGLKIDGTVGLPMRGGEALLSASSDGLSLDVSRVGVDVAAAHATELRLTAEEGRLLAAARERGPRQPRADLCCTAEGALLVAESTFDSHEANASLLLELGCTRSAALDRGTEASFVAFSDGEAKGPFERTVLIALDRPLLGRSVVEPREVSGKTPVAP
jgi:hypothetical protein